MKKGFIGCRKIIPPKINLSAPRDKFCFFPNNSSGIKTSYFLYSILGYVTIKLSLNKNEYNKRKDYTLINILPNLGYNEKILKLNSDIYVLFGGERDGAVSESLTLFLDLNKFEVVYYEYINRIFEEINPLFKDNYYIYYKWHVWTNGYEHKEERLICKLIHYENSYRFIISPDYYIYTEGFFSYIIDNK